MALKNPAFAKAIQEFLEFLQAQKGAYADACAGYRSNHQEIKLQVSRVMKATGRKLGSSGIPSVVHTTVEDPTAPNVIVRATRLSEEFLDANAKSGTNEQQLCRAIVVFLYTYWEDVTRRQCADACSVPKKEIRLPVAGDLRHLRNAILHDQGILGKSDYAKCEVLREYFKPDTEILFSHEKMNHIFRLLDKGIAELTVEVLEVPSPPGGWTDLNQVAIGGPQQPRPASDRKGSAKRPSR